MNSSDRIDENIPLRAPWKYRPGPDIAFYPPPGLVQAQHLAKRAAEAALCAAVPGVSERELELIAGKMLRRDGVTSVWTTTIVTLGSNTHVCFPTSVTSDLRADHRDVMIIDIHPISPSGFWGDCTRSAVIGHYPDATDALSCLQAVHQGILSRCRPGMPACDLFRIFSEALSSEGFRILDELENVGHSLTAGAAYLDGFIDRTNQIKMWGAWAIEPFVARGNIAVKIEDVVWFGREECIIV